MQISKTKHLKICEDFGKIMNEDSRCLEKHYKWRNYVPKSQDILNGSKHRKDEETGIYVQENTLGARSMIHTSEARSCGPSVVKKNTWAPQVWARCPKCDKNTLGRPTICTPSVWDAGHNWFLLLQSGKILVFKPNFRWILSL